METFIRWNDYYSVGDASLDAQHKQILAIINELYDAKQRGVDRQTIASLLGRLAQYTVDHFRYEEECLRAHEYPELAEHAILHEKMREKTLSWQANADLISGRDLLAFLKQWWCDHIQREDKKYASCLMMAVKA
ncbi:MAG: bacteriohemerythrin [Planctomycetaceae bacterium]|nr:bacteriohemerythrin [Planctomycetaceae bacterium]